MFVHPCVHEEVLNDAHSCGREMWGLGRQGRWVGKLSSTAYLFVFFFFIKQNSFSSKN